MKIEHLEWDSDFFGIKIGKIIFNQSENDLQYLFNEANSNKYQLIYVFSEEDTYIDESLLNQWNGKLVDRKIVYQKPILTNKHIDSRLISQYKSTKISDKLLELAYVSGQYSRFRLDKNLPNGSFERMYKEWVLKSLNSQMADRVFIAKDGNDLLGFVTLKIKNKVGEIGLISVDNIAQGKGLGTKLINACEEYLSENSIQFLSVPTQMDNKQACHFYENYGFEKHTVTNIYHFWI